MAFSGCKFILVRALIHGAGKYKGGEKMNKKKTFGEKEIKDSCKYYTDRYCSYKDSCKKCMYNPLINKEEGKHGT